MKHFLVTAILLLVSLGTVRSETLDEALARCLAGEEISKENLEKLTNAFGPATEAGGVDNDGSRYLNQVKLSIIYLGKALGDLAMIANSVLF